MDYSHFALLLLALGLALLAAEIFIPSGGTILIAALGALGASLWCAWHAWWTSDPTLWWTYLTALVLLIPISIAAALYIVPRTPWGRRIFLEGPSPDEVDPSTRERAQLEHLIGRRGQTVTLLNPGGLVRIDGERMHCTSEGMMLDPGTDVEVVAVRGHHPVVREVPPAEGPPSDVFRDDSDEDDEDRPPLDFDVSPS